MKKKVIFTISFVSLVVLSLLSFGFNIYFLATEPVKASGLFSAVKGSVVEIKAETDAVGTSYGTAVMVDDNTLVTNAHVVTYTKLNETYVFENISVRFVDEENFRGGELVKYDTDLDLAVLKITTDRKLKPIKTESTSSLNHGDRIFAVGNMSNYGISITEGIVSIPNIFVKYNNQTREVIQCDLTISDGNSGGALINEKGKLIGITTFRLKDQSGNIIYGVAYCIPIDTVLEYIKN